MAQKIILDTDIGDDIDDALALALILASPELDLVGVTTVFKNTAARARMAKAILQLADRDVPVFAGCGQPIDNPVDETEIPCQVGPELDGIGFNAGHAVSFIIEQARALEGELVLCPIGPLTNIALAIRQDPAAMRKIKEIVLMGGCFYQHCNEWNIFCDPEAAQVVFESGIPIRAVGLDVTMRCRFTNEQMAVIRASASPLQKQLTVFIERWVAQAGANPILHDPLAVTALWNAPYLTFKREKIAVETRGRFTRGTTFNQTGVWGEAGDSMVQVACNVRPDAFLETVMQRVFS